MAEKSIDEVRKMFENDRFATENGMIIDEIGDHYAKCSFEISKKHRNAYGGLMGGATFTLADFAFAVASNWQGQSTVSLTTNINFLGKPKGGSLIAEAKMVKDGRTTCYYRVDLTDELGTSVAAAVVTGFHVG